MPSLVPREIEDNTYLKVESVREGTGGGGGWRGANNLQLQLQLQLFKFFLQSYYVKKEKK